MAQSIAVDGSSTVVGSSYNLTTGAAGGLGTTTPEVSVNCCQSLASAVFTVRNRNLYATLLRSSVTVVENERLGIV